MTFRSRILLGFVLVQLATAALVLGWYFYSLQAELGALTRSNAQEAVLRSIEATEDYFRPAETVSEAGRYLFAADLLGRDRPDQLERYFFEQLRRWPQIAGLYLGYPDGGFFYVMRSDKEVSGGTRTKIIRPESESRDVALIWRDQDFALLKTEQDSEDSYDPRTRTWYQAAVKKGAQVWTEPYVFFTSRKPGITLASPVAGEDGQPVAVFGVDIEMGEISGFLTRNSLGLRGTAFITTADGAVIAHSSADVVVAVAGDDKLRFRSLSELGGVEAAVASRILSHFSQGAAAGPAAVWEEESDDGDLFVAAGRMSEVSWPWMLVVAAPKSDQLEVGRSSNLMLIAVILLGIALAGLVGFGLSRNAGALLARLHRNAQLARNGNVELMDRDNTGDKDVDGILSALNDLARYRRNGGGR